MLQPDLTRYLKEARAGDPAALKVVFEAVYEELRAIAHQLMKSERGEHTLQPTALVHEAYLRLVRSDAFDWNDRSQFFATATSCLRRILVEHARSRCRDKRGGDWQRVPLEVAEVGGEDAAFLVLAIDEAVSDLARFDPSKAQMVELRFFGGMSMEEIARVLGVSESTVFRDWRLARAWLQDRLERSHRDPS